MPVPVVTIKDMSELEDEDAFVAMLDAKMLEANCAIIKVSVASSIRLQEPNALK